MATARPRPSNFDEDAAAFPPEVQAVLRQVRAAVLKAAPDATEVISYQMPALRQHGILVFFAAFKHHIGSTRPSRVMPNWSRPPRRMPATRATCAFPSTSPCPWT